MSAQKPVSREYRIYLALWRKAFQSGEEIKVKCSNFAMAVAMRQGMYRAIRPFRRGEANDHELQQASEKYVIYMEKAGAPSSPHFLIFKERKALAELEGMWEDLGIDEEDLLLGDERALSDELTALIEDGAPIPRPSTPFFSRES